MASEPKSLTMQENKICVWTTTSVLLKNGFGGTGVEMTGKKMTLDHVRQGYTVMLGLKPERRKSPITREIDQC